MVHFLDIIPMKHMYSIKRILTMYTRVAKTVLNDISIRITSEDGVKIPFDSAIILLHNFIMRVQFIAPLIINKRRYFIRTKKVPMHEHTFWIAMFEYKVEREGCMNKMNMLCMTLALENCM